MQIHSFYDLKMVASGHSKDFPKSPGLPLVAPANLLEVRINCTAGRVSLGSANKCSKTQFQHFIKKKLKGQSYPILQQN